MAEDPIAEGPPSVSAVEALARDPSSRKRFLKGLGGGAAASAFGLVLAACGSSKVKPTAGGSNPNTGAGQGTDQYGKGDIGILGFALTLDYLEEQFYAQVVHSGVLTGKALAIASAFGAQEKQHVATLEAALRGLGAQLPRRPVANFSTPDPRSALQLASTLEGLAAGALLGQLDRIESKQVLATAISMHTVEARHAAAINELVGADVSPDGAFAQPIAAPDALQNITPYLAA